MQGNEDDIYRFDGSHHFSLLGYSKVIGFQDFFGWLGNMFFKTNIL
jgi:hypothetical protein